MAVVEKNTEITEKTEKEDKIYYRVFPDMRRRIDHDKKIIEFEIALPGVKKENIILKALPTWFHINAKRGHLEYSANQSWGEEIVPEKTTAHYENGLLIVKAVIKDPFEGAKEIKF